MFWSLVFTLATMLKFQFWKKFFGGKWDFLRLLARRGKWVWVFNVPAEKTIWERELKIYLFIWRGNLIWNPNIFCRKSNINLMRSMNSHFAYFNLFHATGLFRYPLKTSEKLVFWCFQWLSKETSGMNWVKKIEVYESGPASILWSNIFKTSCPLFFFLSQNVSP